MVVCLFVWWTGWASRPRCLRGGPPLAKDKKIPKITKVTRIHLDHNEDDSDFETPEEIRKLLVDRDSDGVPDGVQGSGIQGGILQHESEISYEFNGKKYGSLDEMPPDVRAYFENMGLTAEALKGSAGATGTKQLAHEETRDIPPPSNIASEPTVEIHYTSTYDKLKYVIAAVVAIVIAIVIFYLLKS